jgi:hypothetical protein
MEKANEIVAELKKLLGEPVVFIRWPRSVKGTKRRWKHLRPADMTAGYLSKLPSGNIGVALGEVSGGLCGIDIDVDELVEPFLAANPQLRETLQTHGSKGRVFWMRFIGEYPNHTFELRTQSGGHAGEFRSTGTQSIIWGIHPDTNQPYRLVTKKPVITLKFHSLRWPVEINNPCKMAECTERTETTEKQSNGSNRETDVVVLPQGLDVENNDSTSEIRSIEEAVQSSLPSQPHENHHSLFILARALLAFQKYRRKQGELQPTESLSNDCLRTAFDRWHFLALTNLRPGQSKDEYFMEFLAAWAGAKVPLGESSFKAIWESTKEAEPPPIATQFSDPRLIRLCTLCRELQRSSGEKPFYLAVRTVQELFELPSPSTAHKWLTGLQQLKIIEPEEKGGPETNRATRFRYLPPLD